MRPRVGARALAPPVPTMRVPPSCSGAVVRDAPVAGAPVFAGARAAAGARRREGTGAAPPQRVARAARRVARRRRSSRSASARSRRSSSASPGRRRALRLAGASSRRRTLPRAVGARRGAHRPHGRPQPRGPRRARAPGARRDPRRDRQRGHSTPSAKWIRPSVSVGRCVTSSQVTKSRRQPWASTQAVRRLSRFHCNRCPWNSKPSHSTPTSSARRRSRSGTDRARIVAWRRELAATQQSRHLHLEAVLQRGSPAR